MKQRPGARQDRFMRAIVQDRYGSPDVLSVQEIPQPAPDKDQVLVRVRAASVNARDWHVMRGDPYVARLLGGGVLGLRRPAMPIRGTDFAGEVVAVGHQVTRFRVGDEVFGEHVAAFAEYVCAPEELVAPRPANLSVEQAAALPLAANTALMGIRDIGTVGPGHRVLINGASGGVGLFAVQLARSFGAHVTAVCRTRNIELVRSAGADDVIDYTRTDFAATGVRWDVVFDLVGNRSLRDLRRAVRPGGTLILSGGGVSTGGSILGPMGLILRGALASRFVQQTRIRLLDAKPSAAALAAIRELAESAVLTPVIDRAYPLEQAAEAIRYIETEHARAKVVVTVA
jgi:NADPH:quinone reductase-like Zn-dependent oxidoreductase